MSRQIVIDGVTVKNIDYYGNDTNTAYYYGELVFSKYFYTPYKIRLNSNKIAGKKQLPNPAYTTWNEKYVDLRSKVSLAEENLKSHMELQPTLDKYTPEYEAWYKENERLKKIYTELNEDLTFLEKNEPKPQYIENPLYTSWKEKYDKYLLDYNTASDEYKKWQSANPKPDRYIDNPDWKTWNENQHKLEQAATKANDEYANFINNNPEPEKESKEWKDWNKEQADLKKVLDEKTKIYNDWWYANQPEPAPTIVDPAWETWNKELQRLKKIMDEALNAYNKAKGTYDAYVETNNNFHTELTRLEGIVTEKEAAKKTQATVTQKAWDDYAISKGKQDDAEADAQSWAGVTSGYGVPAGDYSSYNTAIEGYSKDIQKAELTISLYNKQIEDDRKLIADAEAEIKRYEDRKKSIYNSYYEQYVINNEDVNKSWNDYVEQKQHNENTEKEIRTLKASIEDNNETINHWKNDTLPSLQKDLDDTNTAISKKEQEIKDAEAAGVPPTVLDPLKTQLQDLKDHKEEVVGKILRTNENITRLEQQNADLQSDISTKETALKAGKVREKDLKKKYDNKLIKAQNKCNEAYNNDSAVIEANRIISAQNKLIEDTKNEIKQFEGTVAQAEKDKASAEANKSGLTAAWSAWEKASAEYNKWKEDANKKYKVWEEENKKLSKAKSELAAAQQSVKDYKVKVDESDRILEGYKSDSDNKKSAYDTAKANYDRHKANEPAKGEVANPEHTKWKAEQKALQDAVYKAADEWNNTYRAQPDIESNEWKTWSLTKETLKKKAEDASAAEKAGKKKEPEYQIENPKYAPWEKTNTEYKEKIEKYKKILDNHLESKPDKEILNPKWDEWNKKKTAKATETEKALKAWKDYEKQEPSEKYIKNEEWIEWDKKRQVLEKELEAAQKALSQHLAVQPAQYITKDCFYYTYSLNATRLETPTSGYASSTICNISALIENSQTVSLSEGSESLDFPKGNYNETLLLDMSVNDAGKNTTSEWASLDMEYKTATLVVGTKDSFYTTYVIDINKDLIVNPVVYIH